MQKTFIRFAKHQHAALFTAAESNAARVNPDEYWGRAATGLHWSRPCSRVLDPTGHSGVGHWFVGSELNVCFNAVDRHAAAGVTHPALYFDSPLTNQKYSLSYSDLQHRVSAMARVLQNHGVGKGHAVVIYMSNCPEAVVAMLACARIGAPHSVVFGGFAASELAKRVVDSGARVVLCNAWGVEPGRIINYKSYVDDAIAQLGDRSPVKSVIVNQRVGLPVVPLVRGRDVDLTQELHQVESKPLLPCVPVPSDHPLYILYTSGTTGLPKGIARDTAGVAVMLHNSMKSVFGLHEPGDVIFTTSDIGWIVGHNYIVYAPLLRGLTSVLYEGKPVGTPDPGAFARVVEEYRVKVLFSAPTAFRAIRAVDPNGDALRKHDTSSLQRLYLAGERSDPPTLEWAHQQFRVPVIDNWWQTETGSPITSAPYNVDVGTVQTHYGAAGMACPGWSVHKVHGLSGDSKNLGELGLQLPLPPGALTGIWGRPGAMEATYLSEHSGYFSTFDAGEIDDDGFVHVMARTDDVINVAGHRLSTGQLEQTLAQHQDVAEAAVIAVPCSIKGHRPFGVVVLKAGHKHDLTNDADRKVLQQSLDQLLRAKVGPIASAQCIVVSRLPKTRSGKVVRKLLRQLVEGQQPTPPPTLEDHSVVAELAEQIKRQT